MLDFLFESNSFFLNLIFSAFIGIISILITHHFIKRRDVINKRKELIIEHLIGSYLAVQYYGALERFDQFGQLNDAEANELLKKVGESLNKIDLFGNEEQIEILKKIKISLMNKDAYKQFSENQSILLIELQNALRKALRKELKLKNVESGGGGIIISKNSNKS